MSKQITSHNDRNIVIQAFIDFKEDNPRITEILLDRVNNKAKMGDYNELYSYITKKLIKFEINGARNAVIDNTAIGRFAVGKQFDNLVADCCWVELDALYPTLIAQGFHNDMFETDNIECMMAYSMVVHAYKEGTSKYLAPMLGLLLKTYLNAFYGCTINPQSICQVHDYSSLTFRYHRVLLNELNGLDCHFADTDRFAFHDEQDAVIFKERAEMSITEAHGPEYHATRHIRPKVRKTS